MESLILTWQSRLVLLLVVSQALFACSHGSGRDAIAPAAHIESALRGAGLPGATLAVLRGDRIVHLQGYGVADVDGAAAARRLQRRIAAAIRAL